MSPDLDRIPGDVSRELDRMADEDAAEVIARARANASARVQELLEEALIARLLARVNPPEVHTRAVDTRARLGTDSPAADDGDALYLYGIVSADELPTATVGGVIPGGPIETVTGDGLAAVVSRVPLS